MKLRTQKLILKKQRFEYLAYFILLKLDVQENLKVIL